MTTLACITLLEIKGISCKTIQKVLTILNGPIINSLILYEALKETQRRYTRVYVPDFEILERAYQKAQSILYQCEKLGIQVISYLDKAYPAKLKAMSDPPIVLYIKGSMQSLHTKQSMAVVGTREPDIAGYKAAYECSQALVQQKIAVISGLALGCDALGHKGALKNQGITVAVMANGLDTVYPMAHKMLADAIVAYGGCLVSEYPPKTVVTKGHLLERNRIQVGLSDAVLVIQTHIKGGTMQTVRYTKKEGKLLATIRYSTPCLGNENLVKQYDALEIYNQETFHYFLEQVRLRKRSIKNEQLSLFS